MKNLYARFVLWLIRPALDAIQAAEDLKYKEREERYPTSKSAVVLAILERRRLAALDDMDPSH